VHLDGAVLQRGPELGDERQPAWAVGVQFRFVQPEAAGRCLGVVHGEVRPLEQDGGSGAVVGSEGDTDRPADLHLQPVEGDGLLQRPEHPPADPQHPVLVGGVGDEDGELVTAQACHGAGAGHGGGEPLGDLHQELVALVVAERVVDRLELVEVEDHDRRSSRASGRDVVEGGGEPALEIGPVGQSGQRVVPGVVPQPRDQVAVAQGDPRVVGHRLQQQHVVVLEGADHPEPVADDQHPGDVDAAGQGHHDGLPQPVRLEPRARFGFRGGAGDEQRRAALDDPPDDPGVLGSGRPLRPGQPARRGHTDPGGRAAVRCEERGHGRLGPQQFPRLGQDAAQDVVHLGTGAHRLAEAVQALEVEMPFGQGGVRAEAHEQQRREDQEERSAARRRRQADHGEQGGRDGDGGHGLQDRLDERGTHVAPPVVQRDDRGDGEGAQGVGGQGSGIGGEPAQRPRAVPLRSEEPEQAQRHAGLQQGQGEVEDSLQRAGAAQDEVDEHRGQQPAGEQVQRGGEEEAQDQRQLGEGERVRLPAHLDVHHEVLGGEEADGQRPPGQRDAGKQRRGAGEGEPRGGSDPEGEADQTQDAQLLPVQAQGMRRLAHHRRHPGTPLRHQLSMSA
jgi:hypothetical protein